MIGRVHLQLPGYAADSFPVVTLNLKQEVKYFSCKFKLLPGAAHVNIIFRKYSNIKTFPKFENFVKEFRVYYELPAQQETKQIMQASSSDITSFNFVTSTSVLHKGYDSGKETVHPANISLPLHTEDNGESTEHMVEDIDMKTGSAEEETVEYINEKEKVCFQSGSAGNLQSDQKTNPKGQQNVIEENSIPKLPIINIVQKIIETCTVPEGDNFEKSTCLKLLESVEGSDINEVLGQVLVKATNENIENILQFVLLDLSVEKLITFETAFQILLEKIEYLDEIIKLRSKIANIVAIGFRNHIISIDVLITAFYVKLHHPLFLLCLSAIEKEIGKDKLKQIVKDKIDWTKMLPSCSAKTPQLIYETLKDKNLEYLVENVIALTVLPQIEQPIMKM
ncbi:hypothetical protein KUTeg_003401 [Tegillarca granosa]|uniref:Uncharacterized protein n=1 Tax=Tegillarca granosa TaxID=220873 RepID=A0ABQ9FPX9_TEGGR|nr:hypothetical protein KUTeg_003401 [Tegillarca granosa]